MSIELEYGPADKGSVYMKNKDNQRSRRVSSKGVVTTGKRLVLTTISIPQSHLKYLVDEGNQLRQQGHE